MDAAAIGALASAVVSILAPYLAKAGEEFAKEVGKSASEKMGAVYEMVKTRFKRRPAAAEALADFEASPEDNDTQAALRLQLKKEMDNDPEFGDELRDQVDKVSHDEQAATFLTQVYGGEVGEIFNIDKLEGGLRIDKRSGG